MNVITLFKKFGKDFSFKKRLGVTLLMLLFGIQSYGQIPLPPEDRCTSKDLQVVNARLNLEPCFQCEIGGDPIPVALILAIDNTTSSFRPTFFFTGTLEETDSEGNVTTTPITGCNDETGLPKNQITELFFLDIQYNCGSTYILKDLYLAWTDASKVVDQTSKNSCTNLTTKTTKINGQDVLDISPKCGTVPVLQIDTPITGDVSFLDVTCFGGNDGELEANPVGGKPPYTYLWSNGETTKKITGLTLGDYSCIITDDNDCPLEVFGSVGEPNSLNLVVNGDAILCNGDADGNITGSVSGGTPPYTVTLSGDASDSKTNFAGGSYDFSDLSGGSYTVTVTDANGSTGGCTDSGSADISEPDAPVSVTVIGDAILCNGDADGNITGSVSGGTPPYTVTLSGDDDDSKTDFAGGAYDFSGLSGGNYTVTVTDANGSTGGCTDSGSAEITEPDAPVSVTVIGDAILCNGDADGNITGSVSGGTPPYTVTLSGDDDDSKTDFAGGAYDFSGLSGGNYTVTVTDANGSSGGCTDSGSAEITEPDAPVSVTVIGDAILCNGDADGNITGSVSGGTPPYTVTLSGDDDDSKTDFAGGAYDFSGLSGGNYTVTVTDANGSSGGCTDSGSAEITEPDAPVSVTIIGDAILCNGDADGNITGSVSGGTPPYTVTLSGDDDDSKTDFAGGAYDFSGLSGGNYTVTVTDANGSTGGCTDSGSAEITEPDTPVSVTVIGDAILCNGDADGNITGSVSGGTPPYTVTLSGDDDDSKTDFAGGAYDFSGLSGGNYTVTVTDANGSTGGCTDSGSADISEPDAPVSVTVIGDAILCNGDADGNITGSVSGGTPPYTVTLSGDDDDSKTDFAGGAYDFSGLSGGNYTVTVTDANGSSGGCTDSGSAEITEPDAPVSVTVIGDAILCNGDADGNITGSVSGGTPPYTVTLSGDDDDSKTDFAGGAYDFSGLSGGNYTVTVTDANGSSGGCTDSGSAEITEPDAPVSVTVIGDAILCNGDADGNITGSVSGGTPPYTVTLSGDDDDSKTDFAGGAYDFSGLSGGNYTVTVTDANGSSGGCTDSGSAEITEPDAPVSVTVIGDAILCNGDADGNITGSVSGGTPPYTVTLSGDDDDSKTDFAGGAYDFSGLSGGNYTVTVTDANGSSGGCTDSGSAEITEPDAPVSVTVIGDAILCNGDADGNITGSVSGGTPPYTVTLSGDDDDSKTDFAGGAYDFSGLSGGNYTVTVTDANGSTGGCTDSGSAEITEPDAPVSVTVIGDAILCNGDADGNITGSVSGGTPPYTVTLSGDDDDSKTDFAGGAYDFSSLSGGNYTVTVTDANGSSGGCTDSGSADISEPTQLQISLVKSFDPKCDNAKDGSIEVTASGGSGPYDMVLSSLGTTVESKDDVVSTYTFNNLGGGFYKVVVTDDNGCTTEKDLIEISDPLPILGTPTPGDETCFLADGTINLSVSGGTGQYTYSWTKQGDPNFSSTSKDLTGLSGGTYDCEIKDSNDCIGLVSDVVVNSPINCDHIFPTQTDCEAYSDNIDDLSAIVLDAVCLTQDGNLVSNATPGVFFYFGDWTATSTGKVTIDIVQTRDNMTDLTSFKVVNSSNVKVQTFGDCSDIKKGTRVSIETAQGKPTGNVSVTFNAVAGVRYVISAKYDVKSLVDSNYGEATYTFGMTIGGGNIPGSFGQISAINCNAASAATLANETSTLKSSISIEEASFSVAPVPFNDQLSIRYEFDYTSDVKIQFFDLNGSLLRTYADKQVTNGDETQINIDFALKANQVYIMRVETDRDSFSKQVMSGN